MARSFDLSVMVEDRDEVKLPDGSVLMLRNMAEFSASEFAQAMGFQKKLSSLTKHLELKSGDVSALQGYERATNDFLHMIVIDASDGSIDEKITNMTVGERALIARFWQEQQEARRAKGELVVGE